MAGIKQIVAPPETFRFPTWKPFIFYARDSVVVYNVSDSENTKTYIAIRDIYPGDPIPSVNFFWKEMATDASVFSAIVNKQLTNDSDVLLLKVKFEILDSEVKRQKRFDSDLVDDLDSEIRARKAVDSDLLANINRIKFEIDSENIVKANDYDSDRFLLEHNFKSADSEIRKTIERLKLQVDSDNIVKVSDYDSDRARLRHDQRAVDSDLRIDLVKVEHDFETADSDLRIDLAKVEHDFKAADSDLRISSTGNLDSEIKARKSSDSDIRVIIERLKLQVDSDNIVKVSDYDSDMHDQRAVDSDLNVRIDDADSDIFRLKGWVEALLIENDSDNLVQNVDHDSDVAMIYHDYRGADSDIMVIIESIKAQTDSDNIVKVSDYDSDRARLLHDFEAADSDLNVRVNDADSDILRLKGWVSTLISEDDSDNLVQDIDHDSDIAMLYHDYRADDSDIKVETDRVLDSETHDRKAADSDLNVRVDDADSDIARLRGWVTTLLIENDSDNLVHNVDHDSDVAMLYHDYRSSDSDIMVIIEAIKAQSDSDNIVKVSDYDSDRARLLHDFRAADSDLNVRVDDADSDILRLKGWVTTILSENDSDNAVMKNEHDSDLLMTYHDFRSADSDIRFALDSETHNRKAADSDSIVLAIREVHNRAAGDSDLQVQIDEIVRINNEPDTFDYGTFV